MAGLTTFARLLGAIGDHLSSPGLRADLASVRVTSGVDGPRAYVQLHSLDLGQSAAGLLEWADTLTEITASAWRPPDNGSVHLVVTGRLGEGLAVEVFSGVPYRVGVFGADLQPGGRQGVALSVLRAWAHGVAA